MSKPKQVDTLFVRFVASWGAEGAVATAVALATSYNMQITGVFRPQKDAAGLSSYPFAVAHLPGVNKVEQITHTSMETTTRRQCLHCEQLLRTRAEALNVEWTFEDQTAGGELQEGRDARIQVFPKEKFLPTSETLSAILRHASDRQQTIVVSASDPDMTASGPVVVIFEPGTDNHDLLSQCAKLVSADRSAVILLPVTGDEVLADSIIAQAQSVLGADVPFSVLSISVREIRDLAVVVNRLNPAFTMISLRNRLLDNQVDAASLLRLIESSMILIP